MRKARRAILACRGCQGSRVRTSRVRGLARVPKASHGGVGPGEHAARGSETLQCRGSSQEGPGSDGEGAQGVWIHKLWPVLCR